MGMIVRKAGFIILLVISMLLSAGCANDAAGKEAGEISDVESDTVSEVISTDFENSQIVRIMCENQSGSGVIYDSSDGQMIIVTAAHVVEGAESAEVSSVKTTEIIRVEGLDLAFLRIKDAETGRTTAQKGAGTEENGSTELILQGYESAGELIETSGTISETWIYAEDFQNHMMIGKAEAVPGMSGGGAFVGGKFTGIICGIDENNHVAILPASVIASEYDVIVWE